MSAFDISESFLTTFQPELSLPFLCSAPNRLLCAVLGALCHGAQPTLKRLQHKPPGPELSKLEWPQAEEAQWKGISESTTTADEAKAHALIWDRCVLVLYHSTSRLCRFQHNYGRDALDTL